MKKFGWTVWGIVGLVFAPIGMIFLPIGLAAGRGRSFRVYGDLNMFRYTFIGMGALFLLLGLGFLMIDLRRRHRLRRAYDGGNCVDARIVSVRVIPNVNMNGRHPYVIECAYTDAYGEEHLYQSRYLYSPPREDLIGKTVPVYVDRMDESIGFVDTDAIQ